MFLNVSSGLGGSLFTNLAVFFNIFHNAFDPAPPPFEHLLDFFFDGLGDTLHWSKIVQYKA